MRRIPTQPGIRGERTGISFPTRIGCEAGNTLFTHLGTKDSDLWILVVVIVVVVVVVVIIIVIVVVIIVIVIVVVVIIIVIVVVIIVIVIVIVVIIIVIVVIVIVVVVIIIVIVVVVIIIVIVIVIIVVIVVVIVVVVIIVVVIIIVIIVIVIIVVIVVVVIIVVIVAVIVVVIMIVIVIMIIMATNQTSEQCTILDADIDIALMPFVAIVPTGQCPARQPNRHADGKAEYEGQKSARSSSTTFFIGCCHQILSSSQLNERRPAISGSNRLRSGRRKTSLKYSV